MRHFIRSMPWVLAIAIGLELATVGCGSSEPGTPGQAGPRAAVAAVTGQAGSSATGGTTGSGGSSGGRGGGTGAAGGRGGGAAGSTGAAGTTGGGRYDWRRGQRQRRRGRGVHRRRVAGGRSGDAGAVRDHDREQRRSGCRRGRRRRRGADVHAVSSDGPPTGRAVPPRDHLGQRHGVDPNLYRALLNHLASHGFVVIASNSTNVAQGTPAPMVAGVTWVLEQNADPASPMYQRIDTTHIGGTGHSQGGFATTTAGADARITTIAPLCGARRSATCTDRRSSSAAAWTRPFLAATS